MPVGDYNIMWTVDQNLTATYMKHMMDANKYQILHAGQVAAAAHKQETLEWAKFAMWIRGFLQALEGKELTSEDVGKIMDKLATVDPESQNWRFDEPNPYIPQPQPYVPHPGIGTPTWPAPNTGDGQWTYRGSVTSDGTSLEKIKAYLSSTQGDPDAK